MAYPFAPGILNTSPVISSDRVSDVISSGGRVELTFITSFSCCVCFQAEMQTSPISCIHTGRFRSVPCGLWIKLINEPERRRRRSRWRKAAAVDHNRQKERNCSVHGYPFRMKRPLIPTAVIADTGLCRSVQCDAQSLTVMMDFQARVTSRSIRRPARCCPGRIEAFCTHTTNVIWSKARLILAINCVHTENSGYVYPVVFLYVTSCAHHQKLTWHVRVMQYQCK